MPKNASGVYKACAQCKEPLNVEDSLIIQEAGDWSNLYLNFLLHRVLPSNRSHAKKINRQVYGLFDEGQLFQKGFDKASLRCPSGDEVI